MDKVNYTATVLKFARDALTDARTSGDPKQLAAAQAAHNHALQAHGLVFFSRVRR